MREGRLGAESFPVQSGAAAPAYDFEPEVASSAGPVPSAKEQQALFNNPNPARVISFESLRSPSEQKSIRARGEEMQRTRPEPLHRRRLS